MRKKIANESSVCYYKKIFPAIFSYGEGVFVYDSLGKSWYDFFCSAGSLNYGHNHPYLKSKLINYIEENGVVNTLDINTSEKINFLQSLQQILFNPRKLNYNCQFCGPTGANSVEAAIKLSRKVTGRKQIIAFTNSFHGMSAGAISVSSSSSFKNKDYISENCVTFFPFDNFFGDGKEIEYLEAMLTCPSAGFPQPAAFIVELIQAEGGVNIASKPWVTQLQALAKKLNSLLIVDEIQTGCGRTGKFFSFEHYGIQPDLICISKSISGLGLPMSLLLIKPEYDRWESGEHNSTFRGCNYAFLTGSATLHHFWKNDQFSQTLEKRSTEFNESLKQLSKDFPKLILSINQYGMIAGLNMANQQLAAYIQKLAFTKGLIFEYCGPNNSVIKLLPPLTITNEELQNAMFILHDVLKEASR